MNKMTPFAKFIDQQKLLGVSYLDATELALKQYPECQKFIEINSNGLMAIRDEFLFSPHLVDCLIVDNQIYVQNILELAEKIVAENMSQDSLSKLKFDKIGLYRLGHSSCFIKTKVANIIIDPIFSKEINAKDLASNVDAVLITHSHGDHFDLASLMHFPKSTLIIVPRNSRSSLASSDLKTILTSIGFSNVVAPDWYSELKVKDVTLDVLPFYGEQTSANKPIYQNLINWGNTYLIKTPDYNIWPLVDSGTDIRGSMLDVAKKLKANNTQVDVILVGFQKAQMLHNLSIGGVLYWLCLSPEERLWLHSTSSTQLNNEPTLSLSLPGILELIEELNPHWILPYNHGHHAIGKILTTEKIIMKLIQQESKKRQLQTKVSYWDIGDNFYNSV